MNFVESFNLLGVEAKQIPCIKGNGAPTEETVGAVGCLYMDMSSENKDIYKCVAEEKYVKSNVEVTKPTNNAALSYFMPPRISTTGEVVYRGVLNYNTPNAENIYMCDDLETGITYKVDVIPAYIWVNITNGENGDIPVGQTTPEQESAVLGEELVSANGWTTDGWTGDFANGFTHTSGNTNSLIFTMPVATSGKLYQISFNTSQALTTTNLFVRVGNSELFNLYGQADPVNVGVRAIENGNLEFIPASNFTGTLTDISIKEIISEYDGNYTILDSRGNEAFKIRTTKASTADSQNGENNLFVGSHSGEWNTSGYGNVGVGTGTLKNNTSGFWNVGLGYRALEGNTAGSRNLAMGYVALLHNEVGQRNVALGTHALREHRKGDFNIAIGADSQLEGIIGNENVSIGHGTMYHVNNGLRNIAIGPGAMSSTIAGGANCQNNVSIGYNSLLTVQGPNNIGIGREACYEVTTGNDNIGIGVQTLRTCKTGKYNISLGAYSMNKCDSCDENISIGHSAMQYLTKSSKNIALGIGAIGGTTAGGDNCQNNISIGNQSMMSVNGSDNIAIGRQAGYNLTSGIDNVFLGVGAGKNAYGAKRSLVIGASSGQNITTGSDLNVIIGNYTGNNITSGVGNITIGANLNENAPYSSYWLRIGKLLEGYNYPDASIAYLIINGGLQINSLPTTDPVIAGRVWNDNGTLKVSMGAAA